MPITTVKPKVIASFVLLTVPRLLNLNITLVEYKKQILAMEKLKQRSGYYICLNNDLHFELMIKIAAVYLLLLN